jgi:hypothetical protein
LYHVDLFLLLCHLLRLEHHLVVADLHRLADKLKGLVARKERGEKDLTVHCGNRNRVVEKDGIALLLHLLNVLPRDLNEGLSKEHVGRVELGVETKPMVCNEQSTLQNNVVAQTTPKTFDKLFIL